MLKELLDYGWVEYEAPKNVEVVVPYETICIFFRHPAFEDIRLVLEIEFYELSAAAWLIVEDLNTDGAGDSADVLAQTEFNPDEIWSACEAVLEKRRNVI